MQTKCATQPSKNSRWPKAYAALSKLALTRWGGALTITEDLSGPSAASAQVSVVQCNNTAASTQVLLLTQLPGGAEAWTPARLLSHSFCTLRSPCSFPPVPATLPE